jgi:hypothetical protein
MGREIRMEQFQAQPKWEISVHETCTMYEAGDLFHNPFGLWKLVPA